MLIALPGLLCSCLDDERFDAPRRRFVVEMDRGESEGASHIYQWAAFYFHSAFQRISLVDGWMDSYTVAARGTRENSDGDFLTIDASNTYYPTIFSTFPLIFYIIINNY